MSLRSFHLFFILLCIVGADLTGAWAMWTYKATQDASMLLLGSVMIAGGLGLVAYGIHVLRLLDEAEAR